MSEQRTCANCDGDYDVKFVTPDMDIHPVPLCLLCRVDLNWREKLGVSDE